MSPAALKKLPLSDDIRENNTPAVPAPSKPAELEPSPFRLVHHGFASPGAGWWCQEQPILGEIVHPGTFVFSPALADKADKEAKAAWQALHRWQKIKIPRAITPIAVPLPDGNVIIVMPPPSQPVKPPQPKRVPEYA